ncbi:hypothetical protein EVAR_36958_1 [Eumeta japonica]|uniref:Uncharacterized protein n=1 Tax=Eumeta variegata TaxID=151549 RepID=A0A4C1WAG7_EUMVA|nr:hypothetical protein EVAR_36958_1 [Eumeta japonica]
MAQGFNIVIANAVTFGTDVLMCSFRHRVITAANVHSQPWKSHQYATGLLDRNTMSYRRRIDRGAIEYEWDSGPLELSLLEEIQRRKLLLHGCILRPPRGPRYYVPHVPRPSPRTRIGLSVQRRVVILLE